MNLKYDMDLPMTEANRIKVFMFDDMVVIRVICWMEQSNVTEGEGM